MIEPAPDIQPDESPPRLPSEPRDGVPALIDTAEALSDYVMRLANGTGPLALDAERASGYRYSQRAYLVQLRREGAGTALIDPIAVPDLAPVQRATEGVEWVLHAATQDIPCLAEVGLRPTALFDTELAGRLLGRERVGLAALVEAELGEVLEKGHGAADWSLRPLSAEQLRYAALDVEFLVELRDRMHGELTNAGKIEWAMQEFASLCDFTPRDRGDDAWRRTSGIHRIRKPRMLAVVRELWLARDAAGERSDIAVGRILPDAAIIAAASALPTSIDQLGALKEFSGRGQQRRLRGWWAAVERAQALADDALPQGPLAPTGPPPPRAWADRDPAAFARLEGARSAVAALAEQIAMPAENLISPDAVRRVCWQPPETPTADAIGAALRDLGAREWQIGLVAGPIAAACMVTTE